MAKGKKENLKPFDTLTEEEQREIRVKGGIASAEARRKKRDLRLQFEILLEKEFTGKNGEKMTGAEVITMKQFEKALKGDAKAFEIVRDTAGQKPVDKVMISEVSQDVIEEIEKMVLEDD